MEQQHFSIIRIKYQIILAIVYYLTLLSLAYGFGAFSIEMNEAGIRVRNAALAMPLMTVFAVVSANFLRQKSFVSLSQFLNATNAQKYTHVLLTNFYIKVRRLKWISLLIGFTITFFYLYTENLLALDLDPLIMFMNISAIPFWGGCFYFLLNLFYITRYVVANYLDKDTLDLFSIKDLKPISDLVIYNTAMCACFMAFTPMFWFQKSVPLLDIFLVGLLFLCFALYLFLPVFKVHHAIATQKKLALTRINEAISELMTDGVETKHMEIFKQPEDIRNLASLISAKQEIYASSEWPIDLPQGIKGIIIAISVPLSWAAGAVVEGIISNFNLF
uniref:hypothetical protein n=1 Tax=Ningiella ruwaisensis TaxID=2364274 RepID=UPI00109F44DD|nr:hypothetical protein [Ningiella ruwaisensis]